MATVRGRLSPANDHVALEVADVLEHDAGRRYRLWHDRTAFHFLTEHDERDDHRASLARCLQPGGYLVVATVGPDGPQTCSGLPIMRYTHGTRGRVTGLHRDADQRRAARNAVG